MAMALDWAAVQLVLLVHLRGPSCSKASSRPLLPDSTEMISGRPSLSMSPRAGVAAYWTRPANSKWTVPVSPSMANILLGRVSPALGPATRMTSGMSQRSISPF